MECDDDDDDDDEEEEEKEEQWSSGQRTGWTASDEVCGSNLVCDRNLLFVGGCLARVPD